MMLMCGSVCNGGTDRFLTSNYFLEDLLEKGREFSQPAGRRVVGINAENDPRLWIAHHDLALNLHEFA